MSYQALYRRFRPKSFDEVLGQEHVTTILKNQIKSDNIAHAYLFSGTRGTGKTSTAKIFARAVNCENNTYGNPCNDCETCHGILENNIMDVVEMDAASNNSVDDIRELKEKVKYLPSKGRYKVYIIDEVHMLSKGAFNALLKTLEEPPKHLIFILATTEPQKLPATILSRCQRFDFKRLKIKDIIDNMQFICDELNINVEDKALHLIARNADGAMRDSLSMLDQCVSFGDKNITYESVLSILGIVNNDIIFDTVDNIIKRDIDKTLELIDFIVQNGKDIHQFIIDLISHFRNLMIMKVSKDSTNIIDGTIDAIDRYKNQCLNIDTSDITRIINVLSETEAKSKWSSQPRILLEISLIKIESLTVDYSIDSLVERIEKLENAFKNGVSINPNKKEKMTKVEYEVNNKKDSTSNIKTNEIKDRISKDSELKNNDEAINSDTAKYSELNINVLSKIWPDILKNIRKTKISLHALLSEGELISFKDNIVTVMFKEGFGFHRDAVNKSDNKEHVEKLFESFLGHNIKMNFVMENEISNNNSDKENEENSLINKAKELFPEELIEIVD